MLQALPPPQPAAGGLGPPRRVIDIDGPGGALPVVSLRDILRVAFRRRWILLGIMLGAVLCSIGYVMLETSSYTSSTRVLVRVGREKLTTVAGADMQSGSFVFAERPENVNDEIEILRSPAVLDRAFPILVAKLEELAANAPPQPLWRRVVKAVKDGAKEAARIALAPVRLLLGDRQLTPEEAMYELMQRSLAAAPIKETNVFVVGFSWDNAYFAAFALDTLLDAFVQEHVRVMSAAREAADFYRSQATRAEAELHGLAAEMLAFGRESGIGDPGAEKGVLLNLIGGLERDLVTARIAEEQAARRAEEISRTVEAAAGWPATPAIPQLQLSQLSDLDLRFAELSTRRTALLTQLRPTARDVRDLDSQIATLRQQKQDALLSFFGDRVRAEQEAQRATADRLAAARLRLDGVQALEARFFELQGRRDQLLTRVRELHREIERLTLQHALDLQEPASVRVLARPAPPLRPTWPRRSLVIGLAAAFGLLLAIAYAVFAEFFGRTVSTERDAERALGLPVLARLPELPALR